MKVIMLKNRKKGSPLQSITDLQYNINKYIFLGVSVINLYKNFKKEE